MSKNQKIPVAPVVGLAIQPTQPDASATAQPAQAQAPDATAESTEQTSPSTFTPPEGQTSNEPESQQEQVTCVQMLRDQPQAPNGPTQAEVHPDEVPEWERHGWRVAEAQ